MNYFQWDAQTMAEWKERQLRTLLGHQGAVKPLSSSQRRQEHCKWSPPGSSVDSGLRLPPLVSSQPSFFNLFILFIYFWPLWVFVAAHGLSLVAASGGLLFVAVHGFSLQWLLLLWSTGFRRVGFSSFGTRAP